MFENIVSQVKFVVVDRGRSPGRSSNTCYLCRDNWDDFGFKTSFQVHFIDQNGEKKELGSVSIASKGLTSGFVELPGSSFTQLPDSYCSLGHSQGYYEELMGLSESDREAILRGLRDCAYQQNIFEEFKEEESLNTSLLRHVTADNVTTLFPSILRGNAILTPYQFSFKINGDDTTKIDVEVIPHSNPPSNIHVLIGRNGVGKTRILSGLADRITGNASPNAISQIGEIVFPDNSDQWSTRPKSNERFANLITVVFSAFDHFKPIKNGSDEHSIPCQYIGLKNDDGNTFKSPDSLKSDFMASIKTCLNSQRKNRWIDAIKILNSDPIFREYELEGFAGDDASLNELGRIFDLLSSGHKIILLTVTRLVELVDEKTLVLIDEPENHLHPPLLSSFIRAISDLLIKRNAVAIIATHSPVVLQEVPKSCVTKIERVRSQYALFRPEQETYGENIGTLTREVFRLEVLESGFYKTIHDFLNQNADFNALMHKFEGKIGSEGRAIARSIIATEGDDDA
jgi:predicted ATPase